MSYICTYCGFPVAPLAYHEGPADCKQARSRMMTLGDIRKIDLPDDTLIKMEINRYWACPTSYSTDYDPDREISILILENND